MRKSGKQILKFSSFKKTSSALLLLLFVSLFFSACAKRYLLKDPPNKFESYALEPAPRGHFAELASKVAAQYGKEATVVLPIDHNDAAFRWRLMLIDLAESSIDIQIYSWHGDAAGFLILDRVIRAAERGVKVRLLVDDFQITADKTVSILDNHPNIEARVFNPWHGRDGFIEKGVEFISEMDRLNQRMHNKLIIADNLLTIVGGRNIGNAYYGLSSDFNFRDMDVITVGPIAKGVSDAFDIYWNHDWAYPGMDLIEDSTTADNFAELKKIVQAEIQDSGDLLERYSLEPQKWESQLITLFQESSKGKIWVVYDDPPVSVAGGKQVRKVQKMDDLGIEAEKDLIIVAAYFIPDEETIKHFKQLTEKGVRVRILTNSLGSNDMIITNTAYRKWRTPVVESGAELYEIRFDARDKLLSEDPRVKADYLALHTKMIIVDNRISYVGSLNMDPRSFEINTEMGLVIEDPVLGEKLTHMAERDMRPENSWRIRLDEKGKLYWQSGDEKLSNQPARTFWRVVGDMFFTLLPVEDQL